jgi:hypothetical protein
MPGVYKKNRAGVTQDGKYFVIPGAFSQLYRQMHAVGLRLLEGQEQVGEIRLRNTAEIG